MSLEWKTVTLGSCCNFQEGYVNPSQKNPEYFDGDVKWVRAVDLNDSYVYETSRTLTRKGYESAGKSALLFKPNTIVISKSGTVGRLGIIKDYMCGNRATINIVPYEDVSMKFIFYILKNYQRHFKDMAVGSVQKNLYVSILENLEISLPSIDTQNKIAKILSNIDDKIDCIQKINKNLEQLLYNIFNNWFISFEKFSNLEFMSSPMGEIPKGWKIGILKDLISLTKNSINPKKTNGLPYLPIDIIPMNSLGITELNSDDEANSSLITFDKNDILIGAMRVYFHRVVLSPVNGVTRSTCFVLKPKKESYLSYSLLLCNLDRTIQYAQNTSKGTTMPYAVWDNGLGDMEVVIPPENILKEFHERVFPIIEKIRDSYYEVNNLTKLRDTLLPKLMSGEIDVSKINCDLKIIIKFILNPLNYFYGGI